MQLDFFGATDASATRNVAPPIMAGGAWLPPESLAFDAALRRGSLGDAVGVLNRLKADGAWRVLLASGFAVSAGQDRAAVIAAAQFDVLEAVRRKMNGHELRAMKEIAKARVVHVPLAETVAIEAAQIARREHPSSVDPRVDRILAREIFLENFARNNPDQALSVAAEWRAAPDKFSEIVGVSPERIGSYASIVERRLSLIDKTTGAKQDLMAQQLAKQQEVVPPVASAAVHNTDDAGEELSYNRRNRVRAGVMWEDLAGKNMTLKVKEAIKQNIYSRPDYESLIAGGMTPIVAHVVKQVYDAIAAKPATRSVPTDADLQTYIAGVNRVMDGVLTWANDREALAKWSAGQVRNAGAMLGRQVSVSNLGEGARTLLDVVYPGGWREFKAEVMVVGGNKALGALQPGYAEVRRAMKAIEGGWPSKQEAWQKQGMKVVETISAVSVEVSGVGGTTHYLRVGDGYYKGFSSAAEALAAKEEMQPWLLLDKAGRIKGQFAAESDAIEGVRSATKRVSKTAALEEGGIDAVDAVRAGDVRRLDGEDISTDTLVETFGFTGVNFGNWMKGESNRAERQLHLNHAFDSFMDLADVLGVPPKAMSLNGVLGLAFGAQGNGKFAAHFVPGVNQINLTRYSGAGAISHEYGHAIDHYFATQAGLSATGEPFLTEHVDMSPVMRRMVVVDGKSVWQSVSRFEGLRPEVLERFQVITQAMNKREETPEALEARTAQSRVSAEKAVGKWLDFVRKDFQGHEAVFDVLAKRVRQLDVGFGHVTLGQKTYVYPVVAEIRDAYKQATGKLYPLENIRGLQSNVQHLVYVNSKEHGEKHRPQSVSTEFARNAAALDGDKGGKAYWSTNTEKFARAFDAFVSDTLTEKAARNTYLSHAGRSDETVPMGEERVAIHAAFAGLVAEIKTRETDRGVALFSRSSGEEPVKDAAAKAVPGPIGRQEAAARIRSMLGGKVGGALLDSGLLTLVDSAAELRAGGALFRRAWHGSPHDFDRFDTGAIGTGQGIQNYGRGLYFAGSRGVAEHYKYMLEDLRLTDADGGVIAPQDEASRMARLVLKADRGDFDAAITRLSVQGAEPNTSRGNAVAVLQRWKDSGVAGAASGKLYAVELAPEDGAYLAWDVQQSAAIRAKLMSSPVIAAELEKYQFGKDAAGEWLVVKNGRSVGAFFESDAAAAKAEKVFRDTYDSGASLYFRLSQSLGSDQAASDCLAAVGIPGIRYVDKTGVVGDDPFNYVIFSAQDVSIEAKYSQQEGAVIKGATYPDGRMVLVLENLTQEDFAGVAQHEFFHSAAKGWLGEEAYGEVMARLAALRNHAKWGAGVAEDGTAEWFARARAAIPKDTPEKDVLEEMAGYAVEQYVNGGAGKMPSGICGWVDDLLSSLRVAVIRHMPEGLVRDWALENLEPQDLAKMAVAAMKAKMREGAVEERVAGEFAFASKGAAPDGVKVVSAGLHVGRVDDVLGGFVMQDGGRGEKVAHAVGALDRVPVAGDVVQVAYAQGLGKVSVRAQAVERGAQGR